MLLNKNRENAAPGITGECPFCLDKLIPKCGEIKIWHWAHKSIVVCDPWSEGETEWHIDWKNKFPKEWQEVIIKKNGVKHIADVLTSKGLILEFQNSPISMIKIKERETFYGNMAWVFNFKEIIDNFDFYEKRNYTTFRWKHPRQSMWCIRKPLFIDFGDSLFVIKKLYSNIPCGGWGQWTTPSFLQINPILKTEDDNEHGLDYDRT